MLTFDVPHIQSKKPAAVNGDAESSPTPPASKAAAAVPPKKLPPAAAAAMAKAAGAGPKPSASAAPLTDSFKYRHTPEAADGLIAELIPEELGAALGDGAWKVRLECLDTSFPAWLEETQYGVDAELTFRFLGKKPGWNEKNFQVRIYII